MCVCKNILRVLQSWNIESATFVLQPSSIASQTKYCAEYDTTWNLSVIRKLSMCSVLILLYRREENKTSLSFKEKETFRAKSLTAKFLVFSWKHKGLGHNVKIWKTMNLLHPLNVFVKSVFPRQLTWPGNYICQRQGVND